MTVVGICQSAAGILTALGSGLLSSPWPWPSSAAGSTSSRDKRVLAGAVPPRFQSVLSFSADFHKVGRLYPDDLETETAEVAEATIKEGSAFPIRIRGNSLLRTLLFSEGESASPSPFRRSLRSLPPLLGLRPAAKGKYPLGTPSPEYVRAPGRVLLGVVAFASYAGAEKEEGERR